MARRFLTAAALLVGSLLLTATCLEMYFRWASPQRPDGASMYRPDRELGWAFVPNRRSAVIFNGVGGHYVRTNAYGFRDAPFEPLPSGTRRLAVLGDSFVSNLALARDQVFTEVMERDLPGVSVMNLGVNGYGTVQESLLLEHVLRDLDPDVVVVVVYLRNDFTDNTGVRWSVGLDRPWAVLEEPGDGVELRAAASPSWDGRAPASPAERLHLVHFLRKRLALLRERGSARPDRRGRFRPSGATPPELYLAALDGGPEIDALYELMRRLLLRIATRAREAGVPVGLAPSMVQVAPTLWERVLERHALEAARFDLTLPNRRLMALAEDHGLSMLDLLPALGSAEARGESTYSFAHQHWTPAGNRVVAEALLAFLAADPTLRAALALTPPGP